MPARTEKQRRFMGSELAKKKAGKGTVTELTKKQLEDFVHTKKQNILGRPRTDAERRKRHKKLYGTTELPPRGTGFKRQNILGRI